MVQPCNGSSEGTLPPGVLNAAGLAFPTLITWLNFGRSSTAARAGAGAPTIEGRCSTATARSIKPFANKREMRRWIPRIQTVINTAFTHLPAHIPVTEEEMALTAKSLATVADPRLIKLIMKGDEIAGFVFAYPDISAGIQKARGRIWPLGWIPILLEFRRTKWLNANGLALLPKYQGVGANAVLYAELVKSIKSFQFEHGDLVQVDENNVASMRDMAAMGAQWYKRHRVYSRQL